MLADPFSQSFSLFLPTIITGLGYTNTTTAQLFTVPPNMAAFVVVLCTSFLSDKIKARGPIMAGGCLVAIAGYVMLLVAKQEQVRYGGTFLVAAGVYPCSAMIMVSSREKKREREYNVAAEVNLANECIRDGCRTIWHRITSEPPE